MTVEKNKFAGRALNFTVRMLLKGTVSEGWFSLARIIRSDMIRSDTFWWKTNPQNRQQKTDSAYDSVTYDQVKTALSESQAEVEEYT